MGKTKRQLRAEKREAERIQQEEALEALEAEWDQVEEQTKKTPHNAPAKRQSVQQGKSAEEGKTEVRLKTNVLASPPVRQVLPQAIPAPTFDGTGDVDSFIASYEAIATHNGWTEEEKHLRLSMALKGPASRGVHGSTCTETYDNLQCQYSLNSDTANALLRGLRLKTNESIHQFGEKVLKLVQKAYPDLSPKQQDQQAKQEVIYAVAASSQLSWTLRLNPPDTLRDAVDIIHKYHTLHGLDRSVNRVEIEEVEELKLQVSQQAEDFRKSQQEMFEKFAAMQANMTQQIVESQKQLAETQKQMLASRPMRSEPQSSRRDIRCYNCNGMGHISRFCKKPRKSGNEEVQER